MQREAIPTLIILLYHRATHYIQSIDFLLSLSLSLSPHPAPALIARKTLHTDQKQEVDHNGRHRALVAMRNTTDTVAGILRNMEN